MSTLREPNFYVYVSNNAAQKKIKGIVFKRDVPTPVWDVMTDRLIKRLPYMRAAPSPLAALKEASTQAAGPPPPPTPEIPANWRQVHHKRRMSWAAALSTEHIKSAAAADAIIAAHLGETSPAPETVSEAA